MDRNFYFKQLEIGPMENYVYLVGDKRRHECLAVDAAWDVRAILQAAKSDGMKVVGGLLTHTHDDHCNAAETLVAETGCKIYVHQKEAGFLKGIEDHIEKVVDGSIITIGDFEIRVLHTPGHTPGSVCFLTEDYLFTGDTLFVGACGRCDLEGGDAHQMYASLQKLAKLDDETMVLPGHAYGSTATSTIKHEKRTNPYYQCGSLSEFIKDRVGG